MMYITLRPAEIASPGWSITGDVAGFEPSVRIAPVTGAPPTVWTMPVGAAARAGAGAAAGAAVRALERFGSAARSSPGVWTGTTGRDEVSSTIGFTSVSSSGPRALEGARRGSDRAPSNRFEHPGYRMLEPALYPDSQAASVDIARRLPSRHPMHPHRVDRERPDHWRTPPQPPRLPAEIRSHDPDNSLRQAPQWQPRDTGRDRLDGQAAAGAEAAGEAGRVPEAARETPAG